MTSAQRGFTTNAKSAKKAASKGSAVVVHQKADLTWSGAKQDRKLEWVIEAQAAGEDIGKYRMN